MISRVPTRNVCSCYVRGTWVKGCNSSCLGHGSQACGVSRHEEACLRHKDRRQADQSTTGMFAQGSTASCFNNTVVDTFRWHLSPSGISEWSASLEVAQWALLCQCLGVKDRPFGGGEAYVRVD